MRAKEYFNGFSNEQFKAKVLEVDPKIINVELKMPFGDFFILSKISHNF